MLPGGTKSAPPRRGVAEGRRPWWCGSHARPWGRGRPWPGVRSGKAVSAKPQCAPAPVSARTSGSGYRCSADGSRDILVPGQAAAKPSGIETIPGFSSGNRDREGRVQVPRQDAQADRHRGDRGQQDGAAGPYQRDQRGAGHERHRLDGLYPGGALHAGRHRGRWRRRRSWPAGRSSPRSAAPRSAAGCIVAMPFPSRVVMEPRGPRYAERDRTLLLSACGGSAAGVTAVTLGSARRRREGVPAAQSPSGRPGSPCGPVQWDEW